MAVSGGSGHTVKVVSSANLDPTVFWNWSQAQKADAVTRLWLEYGLTKVLPARDTTRALLSDDDYEAFAHGFGVRRHFDCVVSHRRYMAEAFKKFKTHFRHLTIERIALHDLSKLRDFVEILGYTEKWVVKADKPIYWQQALIHHYKSNSHHPEHYVDDNGLKMDMADADLEESVVDMIACHWERSLDGDTNASNRQLADVGVKFLGRYTPGDKIKVIDLLSQMTA